MSCATSSLFSYCFAKSRSTGPTFSGCVQRTFVAKATSRVVNISVVVQGSAVYNGTLSQLVTIPARESDLVVNFSSVDRFGILGVCSFGVVTTDSTLPILQCPSPITLTLGVGEFLADSSCSLSQTNEMNATLQGIGCGNGGFASDDIALASLSRIPAAGVLFGVGAHSVQYTVRDWRGNFAFCTTSVTVLDLEAPVVSCPDSVTLPEADSSLQTPVRICANATDNDGLLLATLDGNMTRGISVNVADLLGGGPTLSFDFSRKPGGGSIVLYRFCMTVLVPTPSSQVFNLTFVDLSRNTDSCQFSVSITASARTAALSDLLNSLLGPVSQETLQNVAGDLQNVTQNVNDLTPAQFSRSAMVVQQWVSSARSFGTPNVTQAAEMVQVFDQICGVNRANADQAQSSDNGVNIVRSALSSFVELFNGSSGSFEYAGSNLALSIQSIPSGNFTGLSYRSPFNQTVVFDIPPLPIGGATVAFTTYTDDRMFPQSGSGASASVVSSVIDVTIVGVDTTRLDPPARFGLNVPASTSTTVRYRCVYYNTSSSSWSSDGVSTLSQASTSVSCSTVHFTNFAVLVDTQTTATTSGAHGTALSYITLIGCCLSLGGIIATILIHGLVSELRSRPSSQVLLGLCVSLGIALIFFIAATQMHTTTSIAAECRAVGVVMHYFILAAFAWMLIQGINLHAVVVVVLGLNMERRMKYYHLLGWGVPLVIVAISLGVAGINSYGGVAFCWINDQTLMYVSVLAPLCVMLFINLVLFCIVVKALHGAANRRRERKFASNTQDDSASLFRELRAVVVITSVMGLVWIFGAFINTADGDSALFLQYCFAIFATLQGLFIFLFHVVLNPQAKSATSESFHRNTLSTSVRQATKRLSYRTKSHIVTPEYTEPNDLSLNSVQTRDVELDATTTTTNTAFVLTMQESSLSTDRDSIAVQTLPSRQSTSKMIYFD